MIYLNSIGNNSESIKLVLALGGLVLFLYVIFSRRILRKKNYGKSLEQHDSITVDKDVLGMDKAVISEYGEIDTNAIKGKSIKVKTILLIILAMIGLYLVFSKSKTFKINTLSPTETNLQRAD